MIARIIAFSVHQRWLVVLLTGFAALFGAYSLARLPIDAVPDITNVQVQINALAPALSPYDVEKQVTFPIETALAGIPGLDHTRSLSRNGFAQVTAVFTDRTDLYFARQQVGERLSAAKDSLPPGADVEIGPISTGLGEIYMWTVNYRTPQEGAPVSDGNPGWQSDGSYLTPEGQRLASELEKTAYLRTLQDWVIRPQLKMVTGVAGIDSIGGFEKQYNVQPDPAKLIGLGLSFNDIGQAIERNNLNRGASYIERNGEGYVVRSEGRVESMAEIGDITVATRAGVPIRIKDVAEVTIGREIRTGSASFNGQEAVVGTALMLIGANSRTVSASVDKKIKELARSLPPNVEIRTVLDRTQLVDATVRTVAKNLSEGALLVILVLFLVLGNIRAAVITALVIPVSMLLTATAMVESGISANLMSFGALDFGLIVDGAIFIAENALRHLAEQQRRLGRPLPHRERLAVVTASAQEMIKPAVFGQAIIILVYMPLVTFTGVEGKMFLPMALTVMIALVAAFALSLTFVPAMIAILVTGRVREKENVFVRGLKRVYAPLLFRTIRAPAPVIGIAVALFAGSAYLFTQLGQEFIPTLDEGDIAMNAQRIPSTSLRQSQEMQLAVENAIRKLPEVALVFSKTGTAEVASDPMPVNSSDTFIILKPREQWPDPDGSKDELQQRIETAINALPGNKLEFSQPIQLRFNELIAGVRGDIAVKVFGDEFGPMLRVADRIAGILRETEGAVDIKVEQTEGLPYLDMKIDKAAIARYGLSIADVQDVLGAAVGGRQAGLVFEGDRRFPIIVRLPDGVRDDIDALKSLPVPLHKAGGEAAHTIPLKEVVTFELSEGPYQVSRENGKRRVVVTANVRGRDIASVVSEARDKVAARVKLPTGYYLSWGGEFENLAQARQRLTIVVPACFFLIYLLLYTALGSARDAFLVFSAVPLGFTGGVVSLWLRGMPFSVSAAVGFMALSGVAVLSGLVMLTSIKRLLADGVSSSQAIYRGAMTRLRPIVMTGLVASLGFVPMAIATETGAEVQRPLATVVIGGLVTATLLTLIVLPALYVRFGRVTAQNAIDVEADHRTSPS